MNRTKPHGAAVPKPFASGTKPKALLRYQPSLSRQWLKRSNFPPLNATYYSSGEGVRAKDSVDQRNAEDRSALSKS
jgi:hypothetical protein